MGIQSNRYDYVGKISLSMTCALVLALLSSCGSEKNADVSTRIVPERPIAFDIDRVIPDPYPNNDVDESVIINKNWFQFSLTVANNSDKVLTIMAVKMTAKGSKNGDQTETIVSFNPGSFNDATRTSIAELLPGTSTTVGPFIAGDLAEVNPLRYNVHAEVKGWYGTHLEPLAPVTKTFDFSTQ